MKKKGVNLGPFGTGGVVLEIVDLCPVRIPGDINNDCVVDVVDINMLIDLGWKTPSDHPGNDRGRIQIAVVFDN